MKKEYLDVLPDPNTYDGHFYLLIIDGVETAFYTHKFVDGDGNITKHWSQKFFLPENATLKDL